MKKLSPRERQAIFREWVRDILAALVMVVVIAVLFVLAIVTPTSRDSYEATKSQVWQEQVQEYKKAHSPLQR